MSNVPKPRCPRTAAEVPEWRRQLAEYLASQTAEIVEAVEEKRRFDEEKKQRALRSLAEAKQRFQAAEEEKAAMQQKLADLKKKRGEVAEQRQQQLREQLAEERNAVAATQANLQLLKQQLKEYQEAIEKKQTESSDRLHAMKAIKKLYTKYTQLDIEVKEDKEILAVKFVFVGDDRKVREYGITLKEITRKLKYEIIDPAPEILNVLDNKTLITNIGKAMYDIRNFLINNKEMGKFRE